MKRVFIKIFQGILSVFLVIVNLIVTLVQPGTSEPVSKNRTMLQGFEWYLRTDGTHWDRLASQAKELSKMGVNMIWLPPAYKGLGGMNNVGYGVYDLYDLGEWDQMGSVSTKYGTKDQYLNCCKTLQQNGIEVLADMVLNHKMGADEKETFRACKVNNQDRYCKQSDFYEIEAFTQFNFYGRNNMYSDFKWNHNHFTGIDYDARRGENGIYLFEGKEWAKDVDSENNNFDYLMGANVDLNNEEVVEELTRFGQWYQDTVEIDGFRLDAVKHMSAGFYRNWIKSMRAYSEKELFTVGEFWSGDLNKLRNYIHQTEGVMSLFDVPLHMHFYDASHGNGYYDMAQLFQNTLTKEDSWHSVTFVDNHDTQPGQSLGGFVAPWFKEIAYTIILLQEKGIPCVFYGDLYGITDEDDHSHDVAPTPNLKTLLKLRDTYAYGEERDYYDHQDVVGFTRAGQDARHGLAVLVSDAGAGSKWMEIGKEHSGQTFKDALGHCSQTVTINNDGWGEFAVEAGSVSVWIPE